MARNCASRKVGWQSDPRRRLVRAAVVRWLLFAIVLFNLAELGRAQDQNAAFRPASDSAAGESLAIPKSLVPSEVPEYVISPEDVLEVHVFDVPEISSSYRVSPTGFITLPLVSGPIGAAGLTPAQLSQAVAAKFRDAGLLSNPQVTVSVKETRLHSVVIGGAVKKPQVYPLFGPTRLLDMLSQAEGLADDAGDTAQISRGEIAMRAIRGPSGQAGAGPEGSIAPTVTVDLRKLLEAGDERLNLVLYPGDRVTVQRASIIYVMGAVGRPGGYPLKDPQEEMTVLKALALAGDVSSSAKRKKLTILRRKEGFPGGREQVALDLNEILAGRVPDPRLQGNDILFVPESGRTKAIRQVVGTGIGVGAGITTGLIIYRR